MAVASVFPRAIYFPARGRGTHISVCGAARSVIHSQTDALAYMKPRSARGAKTDQNRRFVIGSAQESTRFFSTGASYEEDDLDYDYDLDVLDSSVVRMYYPSAYPDKQVDSCGGLEGAEVDLVELPISWHLDDFPWFEYIPPKGGNLTPASAVLETWLGDLDWAREHEPG